MKMMHSHRVSVLRLLIIVGLFFCGTIEIYGQFHEECSCNPLLDCVNFTVITKHYIENHPNFGKPAAIDTNCANVEFYPVIKVTADGSIGTIIEVNNFRCCPGGMFNENERVTLYIIDEEGNYIGNTQPNNYGETAFMDYVNGRTTFTYKHPYKLPDAGMKSRSFSILILQHGFLWARMSVEVYRPPVVFVHGLWADASSFDAMVSAMSNIEEYDPFQFYQADYKISNAASFQYNEWIVRGGINQVMYQCADNRLSVGRVNLVVHSMGGLLSRQYIQGPLFHDRQDVNRLITCNTPHAGSQMANFLLDASQYGYIVASMLGGLGMDCYGGAVDNLRVNSSQIAAIQIGTGPYGVKYHSLITVEPGVGNFANVVATVMSYLPGAALTPALSASCAAAFLTDVFNVDDHDLVVAAESQAGGLSGLTTNTVNDQQHVGSVANNEVIYNIENLLNELNSSDVYANAYPHTMVEYDFDFPCLPFNGEEESLSRSTATLNISSPATGTNVTAGNAVTISFVASMLDSVTFMMRYRSDSIALIANAAVAGSVNFIIPSNLIGVHTLLAVGFSDDNKIKAMDSIHLNVTTTASLDSLVFKPEVIYLDQYDSTTFRVIGMYSDGMERDLALHPSLDFDFVFDNASREGSFIHLDDDDSDTLRVNIGAVVSSPVRIQKTGTTFLPGCKLVTNTNDDGFGSLRYALDCISAHDTIRFSPALAGDTIILNDQILDVYKSVFIINTNTNKVAIRTNTADRIFRIFNNLDVWIENIKIISGDPSTDAIVNAGHLTLKNVQVSNTYSGISGFVNNESGSVTVLGQCNMK